MNEKDSDDTIAANPETVEVTVATELGEAGLAWSVDSDVPEIQEAQEDRRPLPRSLQILPTTVAVGALVVTAFFFGRGDTTRRAPNAAPAPPATTAASSIAAAPSPAAPPPVAAPAIPTPTSPPPTVTVTGDNPGVQSGPPMAHGAALGRPCDPSGPTFGYAADGSVLACPSLASGWQQLDGPVYARSVRHARAETARPCHRRGADWYA